MSIKHSEQLDELFLAISKVQGSIQNAKRNVSGYNNNYKYAELEQYVELSKELLEENGLCVLQIPESMEIVEVTKEMCDKKTQTSFLQQLMLPKQSLTTWIGHKSGQFISGNMEMLVEKTTMNSWGQCTGVAISFMRRYALAGMLGMTQEDDDNQLSKQDVEKSYVKEKSPQLIEVKRISEDQANNLCSMLASDPERLEKILVWAKVETVEQLSLSSYTQAVKILTKEQTEQKTDNISETNLVSQIQIEFLKKLVSQEKLYKILKDYNLNKLEEMNVEDYHKEYYKLREEIAIGTVVDGDVPTLKKVS